MRTRRLTCLMFAAAVIFGSAPVWAQTGVGAIGGVARDTTGAVLPGVTVEASSPTLIEKVRSVITDDQGNYKILELRPGTYSVTFTLPGFATFKREGIELTSGFTATVNGEMKVGSLEETVTVTGASPVVDVQNARTQNVMTDQVLRTLPTGGKSTDAFVALTLGARLTGGGDSSGGSGAALDVGGSRGEFGRNVSVHGSRADDMKRQIDGMNYNMIGGNGGGWSVTFRVSTLGMQESVLESGGTGETETNTQINLVPKDGGNRFSLSGVAAYTNRDLQATNITAELSARGVTTGAAVRKVWDYGLGVGGPLLRDRLWFYSANRAWGAHNVAPGAFWNATQGSFVYTPDPSREGFEAQPNKDFSGRFAWQATSKHKLTMIHFFNRQCACNQFVSATVAPEASFTNKNRNNFNQTTWTYPATNRLLFTAGASFGFFPYDVPFEEGVTADTIALREQLTGLQFNAQQIFGQDSYASNESTNFNQRFSMAYVTGSHALKVGTYTQQGAFTNNGFVNQSVRYDLRGGVPVQLVQFVSPFVNPTRLKQLGIYAQDQWTMQRLTLNLGARYDQFSGSIPAVQLPAGRFTSGIDLPAVSGKPDFKDISPRLSAAYDVFGNGKTAIKGAWGRYLKSEGNGLLGLVAPVTQLARTTSRLWTDANSNRTPDCNLVSPDANGECGAISDRAFGNLRTQTVFPADDILEGWGARQYNWQGSLVVQQELRPGMGLTVGYFRTQYSNLTVTDNRAVAPANYDPYCITTPVDARLPGGGGQQLCGLYNLNPSRFGQPTNNLITLSEHYEGDHRDRFDGVDIELNARFGRGALLGGGVSMAKQQTYNCKIIDSPQEGRPGFCNTTQPWSAGTVLKLNGAYPLPWWGIETSAVLQNLPGLQVLSNFTATNAQVAPSLGRNLAGCPATGACSATVTIPIVQPYTMFEKRPTQLDVRLTKTFRVGGTRIKGMFDVYNLTNDSAVMNVNQTYGAAWLRPTLIHQPRLMKFGAEIEY